MIRKFILIMFVAALIMIVGAGSVSATVSEDMDIQAEIRNIWTLDTTSPIVLFGQNANLGQVLQADLDIDSFSDPLPNYDDRCLGDKNYDKSVISRFREGDDKVRIVVDITGGTGFKPGSEGYIKIINSEYKITKIFDQNDYIGVQPPTMVDGIPFIWADHSGFGVIIDMEEGSVSWQGRGTCPACGCRENCFRMEFLVEKVAVEDFTFVHMTDVHIGNYPVIGSPSDMVESIEKFTDTLQDIKTHNPDFILNTGDIVEYSNPDFFNAYVEILKSIDSGIPIYHTPGNHDRRDKPLSGNDLSNYNTIIQPINEANPKFSALNEFNDYYFDYGGYRFIGLDSGNDYLDSNDGIDMSPESNGLYPDQIIILNNEMDSNIPKIIFMHHPVINDVNDRNYRDNDPPPVRNKCDYYGYNDACIAYNRCDFINYSLENHVYMVLTGHEHKDYEVTLSPPSDEPTMNPPYRFIQTRSATKDESGYRVIKIDDGVISHTANITPDQPNGRIFTMSYGDILGSNFGMSAYDLSGHHTGMDYRGNIIREIPNSYYTGTYDGSCTTPQVLIVYNPELEKVIYHSDLMTSEPPLEPLSQYPTESPATYFNFTIRDKIEGEITEYRYENVFLRDISNASVDLTLANPDYTMEIDYHGDGTDVREIEPEVAIIRETTIQLHTGWNLISIPLVPEDTSTAFVLAPITGKYDIIWEYNASDTTDHWKKYDPNAPFGNDLTNMEPGKGYWILITSDSTLPITGTVPESTDINLKTGWNLIGYNSLDSQPITDAMSSISGNYGIVWEYDASDTTDHWKKYDPSAPFGNDLTDMESGKGYWILMNSDDTLEI